jgi:hypothetical protein
MDCTRLTGWRVPILAALLVLGSAGLARADGADPFLLISTGGVGTDLTNAGAPITVGPNGGGIFVFHNATGSPFTELDVNLNLPVPQLPNGFTINGTISVAPSLVRQLSSFQEVAFQNFNCNGSPSDTVTCIELIFKLTPGPLVDLGQNFVLDFNDPGLFTAADVAVENGTYTGGNDASGIGSWSSGASGSVIPNGELPVPGPVSTPEPSGLLLLSTGLLGATGMCWRRRRLV